jgi:hypothetical protein
MTDRIYLGQVKQEIESSQSYDPQKNHLCILGEKIYIEKHNWDCGWYWGFGYLSDQFNTIHCHADQFINQLLWHDKNQVFEKSIFKNNDQFWIFKDLLKQAYTLKECAEIYQYGGHCITNEKTEIIRNKRKARSINRDLSKVLDQLWNLLESLKK